MHIQQTKFESLASGGPQYYFHSVPQPVKEFLRKRGACRVVLQTPYGIASSSFMAVGRDHKRSANGKVVPGRVGHDRLKKRIANMELKRIGMLGAFSAGTWYRIKQPGVALKVFVESYGRIPLLLRTPYGIAESGWVVAKGLTQRSSGWSGYIHCPPDAPVVGEAIRRWYGLRSRGEILSVTAALEFIIEGELRAVLSPVAVNCADGHSWRQVHSAAPEPLGMNDSCSSHFWKRRIELLADSAPGSVSFMRRRVQNILSRHPKGSRRGWSTSDVCDLGDAVSVCGCSLGEGSSGSWLFRGAVSLPGVATLLLRG